MEQKNATAKRIVEVVGGGRRCEGTEIVQPYLHGGQENRLWQP